MYKTAQQVAEEVLYKLSEPVQEHPEYGNEAMQHVDERTSAAIREIGKAPQISDYRKRGIPDEQFWRDSKAYAIQLKATLAGMM